MGDHDFCRMLLTDFMVDVRRFTTVAERKAAWVYRTNGGGGGSDWFEFHGPDGFYFSCGKAECKWSARFEGWMEFLKARKPEAWAILEAEAAAEDPNAKPGDDAT